MEEGQAKNKAPIEANEPVFHDGRGLVPSGLVIGMLVLALIAIGGVALGVWGMISQDQKVKDLETQVANCAASNGGSGENITVTCPDGTEVEVANTIDNASAQTIIDPYLKSFGTFVNVLDYSFDTNSKIRIAFQNLSPDYVYSFEKDQAWTVTISYDSLNSEYQYLFGSDQSLEKRNYDVPAFSSFSFLDDESGYFKVGLAGYGGTGGTMFSLVKNAYYDGDNMVVEVYHDTVSWCLEEVDESCIAPYSLAYGEEVSEYIKENTVPVYKMIFAEDNGHYVLKDIKK